MRKLVAALVLVGTLVLPSVPAHAVPRHVHNLTTPNGTTHSIAVGVTFEAPCTAFLNFHGIVHQTVFGTSVALKNPNGPLSATVITDLGSC